MKLETVTIKTKTGLVVINKTEYDADTMTLVADKAPAKTKTNEDELFDLSETALSKVNKATLISILESDQVPITLDDVEKKGDEPTNEELRSAIMRAVDAD